MLKLSVPFTCGFIACILFSSLTYLIWNRHDGIQIHKLQVPLLLANEEKSEAVSMLPKGTILYFDKAYPEGFTRYKVYINIDRMPLTLQSLSDSTTIIPIEGHVPYKEDLKKLLREYPLTRSDLADILKSQHLTKDEISEVFKEYLR